MAAPRPLSLRAGVRHCTRSREVGRRIAKWVAPPSREFASAYRVHLSPLPCWRDLSPARHRAACADLVAQVEAQTSAARLDSGEACVGPKRILAQHPHDRPVASNASPAPLVHASTTDTRKAFRRTYLAFVNAFRAAVACLRSGLKADFPFGAFPPGSPFVAPQPALA